VIIEYSLTNYCRVNLALAASCCPTYDARLENYCIGTARKNVWI